MAEPQANVAPPPTGAAAKKVIFADFAVVKYTSLLDQLRQEGIGTDAVTDEKKFLVRLAEDSFDVCVLNLLLGGIGPFELVRNVRKTSRNPDIKIIVTSKQLQKMNIQNTLKAGANDFVADNIDNDNLHARVIYHLTPKRVIEDLGVSTGVEGTIGKEAWPFLSVLVESTEKLSRTES